MTPTDIEALEALLAKATAWPWETMQAGVLVFAKHDGGGIADCCGGAPEMRGELECQANARLIVALRNAAPTLLAELRALREVRDAAREYREAEREFDRACSYNGPGSGAKSEAAGDKANEARDALFAAVAKVPR